MHEKVRIFLFTKRDAERQKHEKVKANTLIELGLFDKVYSPNNECNNEYPYGEWDKDTQTEKYYKKVPVAVTDEEYHEILKYSKTEDPRSNNPIAVALTVIAWLIFIGGFLTGIVLGTEQVVTGIYYQKTKTVFSFATAFTYWCVAFISGMMFLGFSEIIKLLQDIKNKK